ncbi:hypothetical protein AgCh_010355 [Apium graveolens]
MNTHKINSIKIPTFDKANYTLWKKKMMMFIKMANPLYVQILKNGPFIPMVRVEESTDGDMVIPAHYAPKDLSEYSDPEKEKVSLDSSLQLILIESLDNLMYNNTVNCDTAKQIWEKIEILCEGIEEVRSNQRRILISLYKDFMAKPKESITKVFERFNKLINNLQLHDKYSEAEEAIFESGQGHVIDGSSALIVNEGQTSNDEPRSHILVASTSEQRIIDSQEQVILELENDEFYTLEELDDLDQSMAYLARKFSNIRVRKPRYFKSKGQSFNKDNSWKEKGKKPKKAKKDKAYLELEAKYKALLKKQQSKAYIAEGKSWDDYENDEDKELGNYALMALEQGESSSSKSQVPTPTSTDLNVNQYKETVKR